MIKYRPDVDGLRALAVLPVLFFHIGIPGTSGGYVGVDVFFVISGYLITSIIYGEITGGKFSVVRFYERRVRRLLPALFVVILFTAGLAYALLLPDLFKDFGQSLLAVAVFSSNILFFSEAGYFDAPAEMKPLLHTWSLAVEEQFYLFFPPALWLLHRFIKKGILVALIVIFVGSMLINLLMVEQYQSAAFYLLPFRAWELLFGSILALGVVPRPPNAATASALGLGGIAMVIFTVIFYSNETLFPGAAAIVPVLGSTLIIYAGLVPESVSYKILGIKPLVFIGKISYSLYLWHWPLIVFLKYLSPEPEFTLAEKIGLIVGSLVAAVISWRYVEQPFRSAKNGGFTRKTMFIAAACVTVLWIGAGVALHVADGVPQRLSPEALQFADAARDFFPDAKDCGAWDGANGMAKDFCVIGDQSRTTPSFFMWGDSHAGILVHGVDAAAKKHKTSGLFSNVAGCPPLIGVSKDESVADTATDQACKETNDKILKILKASAEIRTVVFVSRWAYYAQGEGYGLEAHNIVDIWRTDAERGRDKNRKVFESALVDTIDTLTKMGKQVYLLQQVPELERYTASTVAKTLIFEPENAAKIVDEIASVSYDKVKQRQAAFETVAQQWANASNVHVLPSHAFFCEGGTCRAVADQKARYFDNNHVTTGTSLAMQPIFEPAFMPKND